MTSLLYRQIVMHFNSSQLNAASCVESQSQLQTLCEKEVQVFLLPSTPHIYQHLSILQPQNNNRRFFSAPQRPNTLWRPPQALYPKVKRRCVALTAHPTNVEVMNQWISTSTSHIFSLIEHCAESLLIVHRVCEIPG